MKCECIKWKNEEGVIVIVMGRTRGVGDASSNCGMRRVRER